MIEETGLRTGALRRARNRNHPRRLFLLLEDVDRSTPNRYIKIYVVKTQQKDRALTWWLLRDTVEVVP